MFDFNNKEKKWNIIFMAFCVILIVLLAGMLIWSKKNRSSRKQKTAGHCSRKERGYRKQSRGRTEEDRKYRSGKYEDRRGVQRESRRHCMLGG